MKSALFGTDMQLNSTMTFAQSSKTFKISRQHLAASSFGFLHALYQHPRTTVAEQNDAAEPHPNRCEVDRLQVRPTDHRRSSSTQELDINDTQPGT